MANTQNGGVIGIAAAQYFSRPKDERFDSVQALLADAERDKALSKERKYNLRDLKAIVDGGVVKLQSPRGTANFTHWSLGQQARIVKAPASYWYTLPPEILASCINHGLTSAPHGTTANVLARAGNGHEPTVRAITTETYGRMWDADYIAPLLSAFGHDSKWGLPPSWNAKQDGAFRGDRDSFLIMVNGGSIVNDPSAPQGKGQMYRAIMLRNSEVGYTSAWLMTAMFRYICGNLNLWGATATGEYRRRHVGKHVAQDFVREIVRAAYNLTHASAAKDEALVRALIDREIAHTKEAVIDELQAMGATKEQATQAYLTCEATEKASPRSFWGAAQGMTRNSQESGYQDERLELDSLAAKILQHGRVLVAA